MNQLHPSPKMMPDLCVIGPGYGGRLVAVKAAATGASVIHVRPPDSAAILNDAAYVARSFIEAAYHAAQIKTSDLLTEKTEGVAAYIQRAKTAFTQSICDERLKALQVRLVDGQAEFQDKKTLIVEDQRIVARRYVLAPATQWHIPTIPGLKEIKYLTPEQPITTSTTIKQLVVLGTSGTALALAQAHRRLGASVIIIPLPGFQAESIDDEITRHALMGLERDGVLVKLSSPIHRIETRGSDVVLHTEIGESLTASHVLIAPSRRPHFNDMDWSIAEIQLNNDLPICNRFLQSSNRRVYVIGGHASNDIFSVANEYESNLIIDHALLRRLPPPAAQMRLIPTMPEIATVGLDEEKARLKYSKIRILRASYGAHPLNMARSQQKSVAGEIKIIATPKGRILGCAIIGDGAADIAGLWSLAITRQLSLQDLTNLHFPDLSHHSITYGASNISIFGWHQSYGLGLRMMRSWKRLLARISLHG